MSRKSLKPQSRRHIWVYDDDWAYLDARFGEASASRQGVGPTIRRIIEIYVANLRAREQQLIDRQAIDVPASQRISATAIAEDTGKNFPNTMATLRKKEAAE